MKSLTISMGLLAFAAGSLLAQDTASSIAQKFETQKAEALKAYLAANPNASDRADALDLLISALETIGDEAATVPYLEQKYELVKGDIRAQLQTIHSLVGAYSASGQKQKANELLDKAPEQLGQLGKEAQVQQILAQFRSQLTLPGVGDEMQMEFQDLNGHKIDTAALKGKVVLIDFWATWCGPCVAELPNVTSAYQKWHDKGFEIIGISLDDDRDALNQFIKSNNMSWPQYFDGKGWQNSLAEKFGISSIPATFLLGKDGKVVATDLRGEELDNELSKLLN